MIEETSSPVVVELLGQDLAITIWWATRVECASAAARRERSGELGATEAADARSRFDELASRWTEIPPGERLREVALRLIRVHDLRAGDALQLAAALVASEERPATLDLVTLDERLALAASREGFRVLPA